MEVAKTTNTVPLEAKVTGQSIDPLEGLNPREKAFVMAYADCCNQARAAKAAGYSAKSAYTQGCRMLKKEKIGRAVSAYMELTMMTQGEALGRLSMYARGTMEYFLDDNGQLILDKAVVGEHLGLIKSLERTKETRRERGLDGEFEDVVVEKTKITLHDAKDATEKILQIYGRFKQLAGDANQPKRIQSYKLPDGTLITWQ